MLKVYGSPMCRDCRECRINFDTHGIPYEFIDINASLRNMKDFLALRDRLPVFDPCKAAGAIGIPAIVREDGNVTLDWEAYLTERGLPVVYKENSQACAVDGRNC